MRIVSDIAGLDKLSRPGLEIRVVAHTGGNIWLHRLRLCLAMLGADWTVVHFSLNDVFLLAVARMLWPFGRHRIATLDFFAGDSGRAAWVLKRIDLMLVYFRDNQRFVDQFGVDKRQFEYIPFKVNSFDVVRATTPVDGDYVFVGGRSRRDFALLFEAVEPLGIPVKVLTAPEADILPHGSSLAGLKVPANVEILFGDSDKHKFISLAAGSRLVALPIRKDARVQAGIGVYLQAMALGKAVIISRCLGVDDVLPEGVASIVEPGDVAQLREQILMYWEDAGKRCELGERAREYAWALGDEDQLRISVVDAIVRRSAS